jgi:hypothetical protein
MQEPGLNTQTRTGQGQREAAIKVDDRCDVKKPAKERPIKRSRFTKKKRERRLLKSEKSRG